MKHLNFSKVDIPNLERRKRRGFSVGTHFKSNIEHGNFIFKSVDKNIKNIREKSEKFKFNPYLVMKVELEEGATFSKDEEEKLESFGLKIIDKESKEIQVVFSENIEVKIFKSELDRYKNGEIAKTKIKNQDIFSKIKNIGEWSREDRIAFDEKKIKNKPYVDIYLWVFESVIISKSKMEEFKMFVSNNSGKVTDSYVSSSIVMARVRNENNIIDKILENSLVYKVEDIEKINIDYNFMKNIENTSIDDVPYNNSNLDPKNSASICVIDSGIFQQHPLLQGVIGDSKIFCECETENDNFGHGTKVASICAYGDFEYNQEFKPEIYVHNAKIHDGNYEDSDNIWKKDIEANIGQFGWDELDNWLRYQDGDLTAEEFINTYEEDKRAFLRMSYNRSIKVNEKLIPNQMREIVNYFYHNYNCRIYNLSQGDSEKIYSGGKPKGWSCVLDELQNEYDIIFVVSSGNYMYESNCQYENILSDYPKFLVNTTECKLIEPANSVNSITVGALATSGQIINPNPEKINIKPITDRGQLSTISRVGPGVLKSIKPDFVAYGGDRGIINDVMGNFNPVYNNGLDKLLFNNNNDGLFCWDRGTSFAAPYISHIAAKILNEYPGISNNMIRSLIASSSSIPETCEAIGEIETCNNEFKHNNNPNVKKLLHYSVGYGLPDVNKCITSNNSRVILMCDVKNNEDAIKIDQMHIYQIPLPEEFKSAKKSKKVIISLAYNPKVRNTRLDYIGTKLDYRLIKGKSREEVINIFKNQKGIENIPSIEGVCDLSIGSNLRGNGTLQKAEFKFSRNYGFNNEDLYLVVNCKKNWDNAPQKYAITAVLETEDNDVKLYDLIKNRLNQNVKNRARL